MEPSVLQNTFPVTADSTYIPPNLVVRALDLQTPEMAALRDSGCTCVTMVDSPPGWRISRRSGTESPHIDLIVVYSGTVEFCFENERKSVRAGECIVCPSWVDRYVWLDESTRYLYCRYDAVEQFPGCLGPKQRQGTNVDASAFCFKELWDFSFDVEYRTAVARLLALQLMREMRSEPEKILPEVRDFLTLFDNRENFRISSLAKNARMSFSTLRRFCLHHFHQTPQRLVNEIRMNRARGLLQYSDFPIEEIAGLLGYSDRFAFSKAFCRFTNFSPVEYRKKFLKDSADSR